MVYAPRLQAPTYLSGVSPAEAAPLIKTAAADACDACRKVASSPQGGLVAATLLGVTAAYFGPMFFDWALTRFRGEAPDQPDEYELELDE